MSSRPSSPKRKRTADTEEQKSAVIKSKYWFDDGNVIIQVENTQFRVHRSMLSRHSAIFEDMFNMPQPMHTDQTEEIDGCPLVHLSDKSGDFEHVMSIFYDNFRCSDLRDQMSFEHCSAILRLGKKYEIEHLLKEGLQRFQHEFPSDLSKWDEHNHEETNSGHRLAAEEGFYDRALSLADEIYLSRSLPAICLSFVQVADTNAIMYSLAESSAPHHLLRQCAAGRDKILCRIHRFLLELCFPTSPIPNLKCIRRESCSSTRALAVIMMDVIPLWDEDVKDILYILDKKSLSHDLDDALCKKCRQSFDAALSAFRVDLWKDLPSIFELGDSWEDLKDIC